ncbi:hypothetical protein Tco_0611204 [Tanacetum coccineum]
MDIRMSRFEKMIGERNVTTPAYRSKPAVAVGNFVQRNHPNLASQMRPPGFNLQNNQGNQNRQNNQGAVYQALPYQPLTNQPLVNQALPPISQIQGVSITDFDNYVKANDALMAITTRSGKTCEGPSNPLVPTPVVSIPSKEPEQNPETSTDKVQKPSSESTAQVPTSELVYFENVDEPFSGSTTNHSDALPPSSSPVKTSDNLEEFADELTLLKKVVHEENFQVYSNPLFEFNDNFTSSDENPLFDEMEEDGECFDPGDDIDEIDVFLAMEISMDYEEGYCNSEGDVLFLESLLCEDTTHNFASEVISDHDTSISFSPRSDPFHHEFAGELLTLPSRNVREHEDYFNRMTLLSEISISRSQENVHANPSSIIESLPVSLIPVEDSEPVQEEIDIFLVIDDLIPPGVEYDDSEDEDNEFPNLNHQDDPSIPRPPPDVEKCLEPKAGILITKMFKGVSKPHDFMADILPTLPTLVSDLTFIFFLSSLFSFGSEDTIFDLGIITFPFSYLQPMAFSMEVSCSTCCSP